MFTKLEPMAISRSGKPGKLYKCRLCSYSDTSKEKMGMHYDIKHKDQLPGNMDGYRYFYYLLTGKNKGSCIMCKDETDFNRASMKYARFCQKKKCKEDYRELFKQRMIAKHGKVHLLDDPDVQKKMLSSRKISGTYTWSDGKIELGYVGSYEKHFLEYIDRTLNWKSSDIIAPSPHVYEYKYKDADHFYMPDFFIPSLNLEIEIKSYGAKNHNEDSRAKEKIKNELMESNSNYFNYIIIVDKEYDGFLKLIEEDRFDA
jgi:hypothetical protein